jgi:hypothetical protein
MSTAAQPPFFDQIGITNIVWLDDLFEARVRPSEVDIVEQVAVAKTAGSLVPHPKLGDLTLEDSPQEWARQIQARLDDSETAEFLRGITPPRPGDPTAAQVDYTPGELEAVVSSLSSAVQRVALGRWAELKEQLIRAAGGGLFLVDREQLKGGERTTVGDDIVKELIERCADDVPVVVLTHSIGPEGTEILRQSLATDLDVPIARLGVVSKRSGDPSSLISGVRAAVRTTLTQLTCAVVTQRIADAMKGSLAETVRALNQLPVSALDRVIFENSLTEGASEIDVLSRILLSRQRTAIDADVAGALDAVHSPLARMRKLRYLEPMPAIPAADASLLIEWRRDEVFQIGRILNALLAPLACGDVFLKNADGAKKYFVLLGQPCDLVVRSDGKRAAREAVLVKLATSYTPVAASEGRYFEVPPLDGPGPWALDFRSWVSVVLDRLEWTSFNSDGRVTFSPSHPPPIGLLPGWERRFERARNKFQEGRQYCLSLGDIPGAVATASATGVEFPYRRVARLRGPRAVGAYAAFASFHARAAFEHDFAKGIGEEPEPTTQPPPTE